MIVFQDCQFNDTVKSCIFKLFLVSEVFQAKKWPSSATAWWNRLSRAKFAASFPLRWDSLAYISFHYAQWCPANSLLSLGTAPLFQSGTCSHCISQQALLCWCQIIVLLSEEPLFTLHRCHGMILDTIAISIAASCNKTTPTLLTMEKN